MTFFGNSDSSGRISKWVTELSEYIVEFEKRSTIKSQILYDFITEWMEPQSQTENAAHKSPCYYYDGAWGNAGAGATTILI
jgi:hypothetical protein